MKFPVPVTVAQFCRLMKIQTISVYNYKRNEYDYRGLPDELPDDLKSKNIDHYYYRPDIGLAIVHV